MSGKILSSSPDTLTTSLALSSLHERQVILEKENQWLLKQIKRKRTELNNYVEQMRSVATEIYHKCTPSLKELAAIDREIHTLFSEILSKRKLGKQSKKNIQQLYLNLQFSGIISPNNSNTEEIGLEEIFTEEYENIGENQDFFTSSSDVNNDDAQEKQYQELESANKSQRGSKIRQIFLRLAEIFHPDKVKEDETQMRRHTEIMKEINKAYQEGDLARLLEIEKQYQQLETIANRSSDDLTRRCNNLEQENEFLKNQYEDLKQELRTVKNTPEGVVVADYRKAVKKGINPVSQMLEEVESEITIIASIRDFVKDFSKNKMTIKDFLQGPEVMHQISRGMIEEMIEEMFIEFVV
ncbi:molecular chaperone DnaJ [Mastigocoleus sp. MO_188.B34]|uniref:molecular chaperone DnaJ n=1 Tax=Mastigocoleus sp. MO_188.B34 TaxID=3036635 RepID=UPI00262B1B0F|nr:molecular chaperone DnaJ [Mastigocoleus sp. MO_188.B34]MDJ0695493.1 molecular chaperone DnaJ [Mastigocoleus sp. MO_188.B34]